MDQVALTVGSGMDMPIMHDSDRYELARDIGSGNFGITRLMRDKQSKELIAIKYIERDEKIDENVQHEIINHISLRHPNIIRFKEQGCHRNLKLENTLLDGSTAPRLKIYDFGYSKTKPSRCAKMGLHKGNSCCDVKDSKLMLSGPIKSSLVEDEEHNNMVEAIEEALIALESQERTLSVKPEKTSLVPPNLESVTDVKRMHSTASSEEHHISGKLLDQSKSG